MAVNIYYQNVRGLRTKTEDILTNVLINSYNVIVFTETWLNSNVTNSEFIDKRYTVYRRDQLCSETTKKDEGEYNIITNPNCFWNFSKDRRGGENTIPAEMTLDDQTANTGTKIPELFAKHFPSVFSNIILPDRLESTVHGLPYLSKIKFGEQEIKRAIK
ncbi:unnamed protein product [Euphydryas editha]|uniref:Uncharacterized protein n=1 Tax=Euphydryas editha TaxID=104508 RepID=A0AAU9TCN0_EUPED|nr:unnamed protein product [Euphydryas editha]